ncbi:poly-gamma-glutamate hydrolase family protein [Sinorhizobium fredii]|uniref:Replication protein n=1 Tax=Rhizobium fredii TaxID=380 RepID=A0A2L0HCQ0_RHIFR|nr:poly-gamma-glutamate hydrolase family protein [Sinorhizobium fredii]AUX79280.1 hypothetical protein NXT3_PC00099 [Sinorhizobium fredii]
MQATATGGFACYSSFEELKAREAVSAYRVKVVDRGSAACIIAPHGGKIEPGTSELTQSVAGEDLSYYVFEWIKRDGNADLHITSSRFDEPKGDALVRNCDFAIALHGCRGAEEIVYIGGRHQALASRIQAQLAKMGFTFATHPNPELQGVSRDNICNRGRLGMGVQLEISRGLRDPIARERQESKASTVTDFAVAIRQAIGEML